ncbi:MAG: hypothetical protein HQL15_06005 [Candidatus Omnitrophica bacterium]|nr:hypothetical protein [Candidatus Omnitrophota bacterium]
MKTRFSFISVVAGVFISFPVFAQAPIVMASKPGATHLEEVQRKCLGLAQMSMTRCVELELQREAQQDKLTTVTQNKQSAEQGVQGKDSFSSQGSAMTGGSAAMPVMPVHW